jgi:hypothetical protein
MALRELSASDLQSLVGTRHAATQVEYPPLGLQPYYEWLMRTIEHLAETALPDFKVRRDDASAASIHVMAGRAMVNGVVLSAAGQAIDLAFFDDDITLVWLENDEGASIGYGAAEDGWPVTPHLKLAEVTIADGVITLIVDRRIEQVLADAPIATEVKRGQVYQAEASANVAALTDSSGGTSGGGTIAAVTGVDASAIHAIATLAAFCNTLRADLNTLKQHLRDAGTLAT